MGGTLATIGSPEEDAFVRSLGPVDYNILIGLVDVNGIGDFQWITGEPLTYVNWGGIEPNNIGYEIHAEMVIDGGQLAVM